MFGRCEKILVSAPVFFCPLNWPFFGGRVLFQEMRAQTLGPHFLENEASQMPSLLHPPLIAVRCQSVSQKWGPRVWALISWKRTDPSILGKGHQWISIKLLDSIPEQDNTKFVVRQARSRLKLRICDEAEQLSTLLVAIKMRNQTFSDWRWSARWTVREDGGQYWEKVHLSMPWLSKITQNG